MTKILKKSLACLLVFVLCFTAIAGCLSVSAAAPAATFDYKTYFPNDDKVWAACAGQNVRAQLSMENLEAGATIGVSVEIPEGAEITSVDGWSVNTSCALSEVSSYFDEENSIFTIIYDVTVSGNYTLFVRYNITEEVAKKVHYMDAKFEAAFASDDEIKQITVTDYYEVFDHNVVTDEAVAPGCETTGLTEGSHCSICGEVFVAQEEVAALGHAWDEGVVDPDATCTDEGVITYTCANDPSHTYTEAISAKGHTEVAYEEVAATCTTVGYTGGTYCSVCDAVITPRTEVPALGHDYGKPVDNGNGTHTATCANDANHTITEDHEYVDGTCACGAAEPAEIVPVEDDTIVVRDTGMLINATLDMRVRVRKSVIPADCVTAKVIVTPTIYDGSYNPTAGTAFVETFEMATASSNLTVIPTNFSLFALDLPMYVKIECYDANENLYKYSPTYTYYPAEELKKQYSASASTDSAKKLNTLITDMLNMSAAAQTYFADNAGDSSALKATVTAGNLVNKDWPQEYATTTEPVYNTVNNLGEANTNTLRLGADLSGAPVISYSVRNAATNLTDKSKLTLTVSYTSYYGKAAGGEVVYDTVEGDEWNNYYTGKHINYNFVDCAMYDGNKTVTFSLTYDGVEVVRSEYSLETYISETAVDDSNLSKCLKAMGIFGASARAYFSTLGTVDPA